MKPIVIFVLIAIVFIVVALAWFLRKGENNKMIITLNIIEAKKIDTGWSVIAELTFKNEGDAVFELDRPTAGDGGELINDVFDIRSGSERIAYTGMIKKRVAPSQEDFIEVASGATVQNKIRLAGYYAFPASGGTFSATFESFNYFSKDAVTMRSNTVSFELSDTSR